MTSLILLDHPLEEEELVTDDWRRCKENHYRRFMKVRGNYFDGNKSVEDKEIFFWGEWEARASVKEIYSSIKPRYIYTPNYSIIEDQNWANNFTSSINSRRHNTDPFVFGDKFFYANCKQGIGSDLLKNIPKDSIIVFGNNYNENTCTYDIDTLLVIEEGTLYTPKNLVMEYIRQQKNYEIMFKKHIITKEFIEISTLPLFYYSKNLRNREYKLYPCKTYSKNSQSYYSFFPCSNYQVFNIPRIHFSNQCHFTKIKKGVHSVALGTAQLQNEWNLIVKQIINEHGLKLGVYATSPQ